MRKCKDCGSDEVFIECNYPNLDYPLYQCFSCYCDAYDHYVFGGDEEE